MKYVESLNASLKDLMSTNSRVLLIGEDLLDPYGGAFKVAKGLSTDFPNQVISTPISESGITGFSIGLAMRGFLPVLEIMFGDFLTLCADQIVNHAAKFRWMYNDQVTVPIVIRTPMGGGRGYGATHSQSLESMFLGVPFLKIVAPSKYHDPGELLRAAVLEESDPLLFIENKLLYPQKLMLPEAGKIGKFEVQTIRNSDPNNPTILLSLDPQVPPDLTIISYGGMAEIAINAAYDLFLEEEINVTVLIPSLIKPFPLEDTLPTVQHSEICAFLEEGNLSGGWGSEGVACLLEALPVKSSVRFKRIASKDSPIPSALSMESLVLPSLDSVKTTLYHLLEEI